MTRSDPQALGLGMGLTTLLHKKLVTKRFTEPQTWTDSLDKCPKGCKMDMRFGTWNIEFL
jgi:hypothetical protein